MFLTPKFATFLRLYGDQSVTEVWYNGDVISERYHDGRKEITGRPSIPFDLADIFRQSFAK